MMRLSRVGRYTYTSTPLVRRASTSMRTPQGASLARQARSARDSPSSRGPVAAGRFAARPLAGAPELRQVNRFAGLSAASVGVQWCTSLRSNASQDATSAVVSMLARPPC